MSEQDVDAIIVELEKKGRTFKELTNSPEMQVWYDKGYRYYYWSLWNENKATFWMIKQEKGVDEK